MYRRSVEMVAIMEPTPDIAQDKDRALLFTDIQGQVVYVDHAFLNMMNYSEAGKVTGESLHKVLRLDQKTTKRLLEDIHTAGYVGDRPLEIPGLSNETTRITVTGEATYDYSGSYIGTDITLLKQKVVDAPTRAPTPAAPPKPVAAPSVMPLEPELAVDHGFVELYFTTHIKAFYVLLSRLVGLWVHQNLDRLVNTTAQKHGVTMTIQNGLFLTALNQVDYTALRAILNEINTYASNLLGQRVVSKEMEKVDSQLHPGVLDLATQTGLRDAS